MNVNADGRLGRSLVTTVVAVTLVSGVAGCAPAAPEPTTSASPESMETISPPVPGHYEVVDDLCAAVDLSPLTAMMPVVMNLTPERDLFIMHCNGAIGTTEDPSELNHLSLEVSVYSEFPANIESAHAQFLQDRSFDAGIGDGPVTPVAGVGQAGYRQQDPTLGVWIESYDGDAVFRIRLAPFEDGHPSAEAEAAMAETLRATMVSFRTGDLPGLPAAATPAPGHVPGHYDKTTDICGEADLSPLTAVMPVLKNIESDRFGEMHCSATIGLRDVPDDLNALAIEVTIYDEPPLTAEWAQISFVEGRGLDSERGAVTPVDGLGQDAYSHFDPNLGFAVKAWDGNAAFELRLSPFSSQPLSPEVEEAAVETLRATMASLRSGDFA